ncbi:DUF3164 family protein [Rhizobium leguminosarum]|uniref:DUF3164 family protein n=1 Tax=Rhizobium leguminosarum TaxID=384 RepID=UPI00140FD3B3|nr:DUF3164 family protein [Rhizobium leguminosarum]QIO60961.1 DUF3164 family protein [Rhizobium leguminosarum bv. trifolii]
MEAAILEERTDGVTLINGKEYMTDAKGAYVPLSLVKPQHKLEDETVRKIISFAIDLNAQIARFRGHTMTDLGGLDALIAQEYGAKIGGAKGNRTYQTIDGLMQVKVQVADQIDFGSELQAAKSIIDECLTEWSADSRAEIQSIITRAFNTDKEGKINRAEIFMLLRHQIDDPRWQRAMDAIRDAMRVTGSKEYIRFYQRKTIGEAWQPVTIDMAKA